MVDARVFRIDLHATDDLDLGCLSADEQAKAATFRSSHDARAWARTRVALRWVLADCLDVRAGQIEFERAARGRLVLGAARPPTIAFNVARTRGMALIAVSTAAAIGVDVEVIAAVPDVLMVARRVLRPDACDAIADAPTSQRDLRFFREWVHHEARLKCRGTGVIEPDEDDGRVDDLTIVDLPVGAHHVAALAVTGHDVAHELVEFDVRARVA